MREGYRGDLTIIPKLLFYCGQIKVVFVQGLWICACHTAFEKYTQMYYHLFINGWKIVAPNRQVEIQKGYSSPEQSNEMLLLKITKMYEPVFILGNKFISFFAVS